MPDIGTKADSSARERRFSRHGAGYKAVLLLLLALLFAGIIFMLRSPSLQPHPESEAAARRSASFGSQPGPTGSTEASERSDGDVAEGRPAPGVSGHGVANGSRSDPVPHVQSEAEATTHAEIEALRERLQQLSRGGSRPGADAITEHATSAAGGLRQEGTGAGDSSRGDSNDAYRVDLPPYDRNAFAEKQRQLEVLRAKTLADLQSVSPADTEGMLGVIKRMSDGIRAQGLPDIIDMPKMEAMLLGSKRINELNAALVAEMGKGAASRPEELARLAAEIQAVQASIPNTVYDLEVVGKLMRGESP